MSALIPHRFLFDFEFPLRYRAAPPAVDGRLTGWRDAERLPRLGEIDGNTDFADVWVCWNETGLYLACRVTDKRHPLRCDPRSFWTGDSVRLCTDMRDARSNRRGTRYCQHFYFLPTGGGPKADRPVAGVARLQRAREDAPTVPVERIRVASRVARGEYQLEAHLPADVLSGFDPREHPRIGFYYLVEDADHGRQYLTVGDDLYWYVDPSTWATAVLVR
ncbi:MAG: hypothetical protein HY763_14995 [Planctomycetes bacterium]|nr:hypothetical protein [Planctomycetota bacterium]